MNPFNFFKKSEDIFEQEQRKEAKKYDKQGERKYKLLTDKIVTFYHVMFSLSAFVIIGTIVLALINVTDYDVADSGEGAKNSQRMAGTTLFLADRTYHSNTHQAEFLFQKDRDAIYQKEPIEMIVSERQTKQELTHRVIELNEEYMLVIVSDVPEKWQEIVMDMGEYELYIDTNSEVKTDYLLTKDEEQLIQKGDMRQVAFSFSKKSTPDHAGDADMSDEDYLRYYSHRQIKSADRLIKNYKKSIDTLSIDIDHMKKQVTLLNEDKTYQVTKSQEKTNQDIDTIQKQQEQFKEKISETQLGIKQLDARKGKLKEWLSDHPEK